MQVIINPADSVKNYKFHLIFVKINSSKVVVVNFSTTIINTHHKKLKAMIHKEIVMIIVKLYLHQQSLIQLDTD